MQAGAIATFAAADIIVSGQGKPDLAKLANGDKNEGRKFQMVIGRGIYYQSNELKKICKDENGASEYLYSSRLLGIILYKSTAFYVYNTGERLIEMFPKREARTMTAIENVLRKIKAVTSLIDFDEVSRSRTCILLGAIKSMLVKIYRGNAYGKRVPYESKAKEEQMQRWKTCHASYDLFHLLFSKIYFASCDSNGAAMLQTIKSITGDSGTHSQSITNAIIDKIGFTIEGSCHNLSFNPKNGDLAVPMPFIDMTEMDDYIRHAKAQNAQIDVYAPRYYADVLSRCFGDTIKNFFDYKTLEPVGIYYYDNDGYPVDSDNYMKSLKPVKEKQGIRVADGGD